jgi:hypothetical protein
MEDSKIRYSVVAYFDLLGFSSHLEIGANDLRTTIGKEAITRLTNLDDIIEKIVVEEKKLPQFYPKEMFCKIINDSIILGIDLPNELLPETGQLVKTNFIEDWTSYLEKDITSIDVSKSFDDKQNDIVKNLMLFIGLTARMHIALSEKENKLYFPGIKTIISSGYRLQYISHEGEDFLSANFAFSNAYLAESKLHGAKLFIDENILRMISLNKIGISIIRTSWFINDLKKYDPFEKTEPIYGEFPKPREGTKEEVILFRKTYTFREMNSIRLAYLSFADVLIPYISGGKIFRGNGMFKDIFSEITKTQTKEEIFDHFQFMDIMVLSIEFDIENMFNVFRNEV